MSNAPRKIPQTHVDDEELENAEVAKFKIDYTSTPLTLDAEDLAPKAPDSLPEEDLGGLEKWLEASQEQNVTAPPRHPNVRVRAVPSFPKPTTPLELATKFAKDYGQNWRYVPGDRDWYEWDAGWELCDKDVTVKNALRWYARDNYWAPKTDPETGKTELMPNPQKGDGNTIAASAAKVLTGLGPVASERTRWDSDTALVGLGNGWCLDARKKVIRLQQREDYLTKHTAGTPWDYNGSKWESLIQTVIPNELERRWFGCFLGQALLGRGLKEALFMPGEKNTGKSTVLGAILHAIKDYGTMAKADILLANKGGSFMLESVMASFKDVRLVGISESKEMRKLDDYALKSLVGNDELIGRKIGQDAIRFKPVFSIVFAMNAVPDLTDIDDASWVRLSFLPFDEQIPKNQQIPDYSSFLRTPDEVSAILCWLIEHATLYLEKGMPPQSARMLEYKELLRQDTEDTSTVWQFMEWACGDAPGEYVFLGDIHEKYAESLSHDVEPIWGKSANIAAQRQALAKELRRLGYEIPQKKMRDSEGVLQRYVTGVSWKLFN